MRNLKIFFSSLIFMFSNIGLAFSDVTASVPTNLISSIATATSFSSVEQISSEAASEIQETTSSIVDSDALVQDVQESAEAFGEAINEASSKDDQTQKFAVLGGKKNEFDDRDDLEPTLGTLIYDTGMRNMTREGGVYDTDNENPDGGEKTIFSTATGAQQARVITYVDFNREILFGSVENKITLSDGTEMTAVLNGRSTTISKDTLPVDKRLSYTMSSETGLPLNVDDNIDPTVANDEQPFMPEKLDTFENSLLASNGEINDYQDPGSAFAKLDQANMQKSISHGTGGDNDVLVLARFKTEGDSGTPGLALAAIEAYNGDPCASASACTSAELNEFKAGIERYSFEVETTATKFTGDLPQ